MKLQYHVTASAAVSGLLHLITHSWALTTSSFIAGIFIDLDHILDVVREHGWSIKLKEFFHVCNTCQFKRIYLIWHGWEWLLLFGFAAWLTGWNPWISGILIGLSHHLVLDAVYSAPSFWSYSLLWRWKQGFDFDTIFQDKPFRRLNNT